MNDLSYYVRTYGPFIAQAKDETERALVMSNLIREIRSDERRRAVRIAEKAAARA